jgi:hypothetical protein
MLVVTRDNPGLPRHCRPRQVALLVHRSLVAFNAGDTREIARLVNPENGGWYSVTEQTRLGRRHFVTSDQQDLLRYVERRHAERDRMALSELAVGDLRRSPTAPDARIVDIELALRRTANDLRQLGIRTDRATGKGAVDCDTRQIVVWSIGMTRRVRREPSPGCPRPAERTPGAILVCAR